MKRVVLDTNVFVGALYNPGSASRLIVEACRSGRLTLLLTTEVQREYERILRRALPRQPALERLSGLLASAEIVVPQSTPPVVDADPSDDKFLAAAVAGNADALVTSDRHLLDFDGYQGVRVLRPSAFVRLLG